jgi:hypothetical protein
MQNSQNQPRSSSNESHSQTATQVSPLEDIEVVMSKGLQFESPQKLREWLISKHREPCLATITRYEKLVSSLSATRSVTFKTKVSVRLMRAALMYLLTRSVLKSDESDEALLRKATTHWKNFANVMTTSQEVSDRHHCAEQGFLRLSRYLEGQNVEVFGPDDGMFQRRVGRVQKIRSLPSDWREVVIDNIVTSIPNLRAAIITMAFTGVNGCRFPRKSGVGNLPAAFRR